MQSIPVFGDIKNQKSKFHQHKEPLPIKNIDINNIVVASKFPFGKKGFKYFFAYKGAKNRKVHIEKTLMKLNLCIFFLIKK